MKRILLLTFLLSIVFIACQHSDKKKNTLLNKDKLTSQFFSVNTNKDTTLSTANGAFISIPQGAFSGNATETVQLEIKEAYSMEQIIMAGLTTQSDGQPLSSGGMIYINAVGEQSIKITKALSIKIPTPSLDKRMQLYKGDTDVNGNINWTKPDSLPANPQTVALNNGRILFENNCASCHNILKEGTGPALANILARQPDKKLLYEYTRNNIKVMTEGNQYYRCLYETRNKTAMNLFPGLTDQLLDTLYGYIENESKIQGVAFTKSQTKACFDSCQVYQKLKTNLEKEKNKLTEQKVAMIIRDVVIPPVTAAPGNNNNRVPDFPSNEVAPIANQSLYYQFKIETFGWYNIDVLLKSEFNNAESSLMVRIRGQYKQNFNVYLAIPSVKILLNGGLLEDKKDEYGFYTKDGKIALPQNALAYIFALGEAGDQIIFDKKEFTTSLQQQFDMTLSVTSKEVFNSTIKELKLPDFKMTAYDTKNADTLRKVIKKLDDIEKIKPKNCDCNCGVFRPAADTAVYEFQN